MSLPGVGRGAGCWPALVLVSRRRRPGTARPRPLEVYLTVGRGSGGGLPRRGRPRVDQQPGSRGRGGGRRGGGAVSRQSPGPGDPVDLVEVRRASAYEVTVEPNLEPLRQAVEARPSRTRRSICGPRRESLALVGRASSQAVADRALALVAASVKGAVSNLQVAPPPPEKQMLLRVRFAELNRSAAAEFGLNLLSTGARRMPGRDHYGAVPVRRLSATVRQRAGQRRRHHRIFDLRHAEHLRLPART